MEDGRGCGPPSINVRRVGTFEHGCVGEGMAESKITPRREEDKSISDGGEEA